MPMISGGDEAGGPHVVVEPSVPVELDWVLSGAHRPDRAARPAITELYRRRPDLAQAVVSLWGPDETLSYHGYMELSAVAHQGGRLFGTDGQRLVEGLESLCAKVRPDLPFLSETPDDAERLRARLGVLRSSARRRRRYVQTLTAIWEEVAAVWEGEGVPAVVEQRAVELERVSRSRSPLDYIARTRGERDCPTPVPLAAMLDALGPAGEVAVVPTYFHGTGLIVHLPGTLIVGVGTEPASESRSRTQRLAGRLKALADPTRLAILDALSGSEMTVTDIARRFGLSQPTVSNHVKLLRETGLIETRGDGRSRYLRVRPDVVGDLVADLGTTLGVGSSADR